MENLIVIILGNRLNDDGSITYNEDFGGEDNGDYGDLSEYN